MKIQPSLRIRVILLAFSRMAMNINIRMLYPFLPVFARGMGVPIESVSLAVTVRQIVGAFNPLLAPIADRRGRRTGILLGLGIFALAMGIVAAWPTFPGFMIGASLSMAGYQLGSSSMQAYLGDRVVYEQRGQTMAFMELGWSLSFIIGIPLVGLLIAHFGWQAPFLPLALLAVMCLVLVRWILPADGPDAERVGQSGLSKLRLVLTSPSALAGLAMGVTFAAANEAVNLMFGVWMEDSFHLQIAALGAASAIVGISELSGESLTAWLVDRLGKERAIKIGLVLNGIFALILPWLGGSLWTALAGLFFFYITFEFTIVSSLPIMSEILPEARATLLGVNLATLSLGRAFGTLLGPALYAISFRANGAAALLLNMLAILFLSRIRLHSDETVIAAEEKAII